MTSTPSIHVYVYVSTEEGIREYEKGKDTRALFIRLYCAIEYAILCIHY